MSSRVVHVRGADALLRTLDQLHHKGVPHAMRNALNASAFEGRKVAVEFMQRKMTLRNSYTVRSVQVDKATGTNALTMQAVLGSKADYMDEREEGNTVTTAGKHGVAVPTAVASGQAMGAKRTKPLRRANYLNAITMRARPTPKNNTGSAKQRNAVTLKLALKSGQKFAFLDLQRGGAIARLDGSKRRPKVKVVYDLSKRTVAKPSIETFGEVVDKAAEFVPRHLEKAVREQLQRAKVPGY